MRHFLPAFAAFFILACGAVAEDAAEFESKGIAALKLSQREPDAIVSAALYFGKASAAYEQAKDDAKATEMNSFLYWCKKKLTLQQMDAFLKGDSAIAGDVVKRMKEVESAVPPPDDAQKYYARAEAYAKSHPDEHLVIAIRFYEVAGRFKGSDVSFQAQDRSLQEMILASQAPASAPSVHPAVPAPIPAEPGKRAAIPSPAQQKEAEKTVREVFKAELAKNDAAERLALVQKLFSQADETTDDSAARYTLLVMAANLSAQADSLEGIHAATGKLAEYFDGDFSVVTKTSLGLLISATRDSALSKLAIAHKTLIDKPDDAGANLAVGKYLCVARGDFERGLPMLAKSIHPGLSKAAKQDLSNPQEPAAQIATGDDWWELADKASEKEDKFRYQERAKTWYDKALPAVSGLNKVKLEKRIAEFSANTPPALKASSAAAFPSVGNLKKRIVLDLGKGVTMDLMLIPPGTFLMGSPKNEAGREGGEPGRGLEEKQHAVTISKPFYIGKNPVTQVEFETVMGRNPSQTKGSLNPVDSVSWNDAVAFCEKANEIIKAQVGPEMKLQLPTEAQWEYACRAGTQTRFYSGDRANDLENFAWTGQNSGKKSHPIGLKKPNAFGLFEMMGNVRQWCRDHVSTPYVNLNAVDPYLPDGNDRVIRGGCFKGGANDCRSAFRLRYGPGENYNDFGFRTSMPAGTTAK